MTSDSGRELPAGARTLDALLVSEIFPPQVGGSGVLFSNLYTRLARKSPGGGISVTVLTDLSACPGAPERRGPLTVLGSRLATPAWGLLDWEALRHHWRVARRIRRLAARRASVVHCGRALPEGIAAWLALLSGGPRYLCWAHGEDIATALTSRELAWITRRVYRTAMAAIANSTSTASMLHDVGVPPAKVHVIRPGVDTTRFHPDTNGEEVRRRLGVDGELLLLTVGRLQRRKGHDLALGALRALRAQGRSVRYLIVGDGQERRTLETMVQRYGLQRDVSFAGEVPDEDLPGYYAACDIFLTPNRIDGTDVEGFGIVFLEAAATGRPVIGGRSGGVPEAVADGETGLLVSGTDVEELVVAIERLADSAEFRYSMGRKGRERVVREFTWEHSARRLADVHARVAAR